MKIVRFTQSDAKGRNFTERRTAALSCGRVALISCMIGGLTTGIAAQSLRPKQMKALGQVDARFVSYNVEAVEVTGGRFWAPFKSMPKNVGAIAPGNFGGIRGDDARFQYRAPIDLTNAKLRKLASALGPSYVRVSGSWRNSTFFQDDDQPALKTPPAGFQNVMTRAQWKGVVDFARAVDGEIVASVSTSPGTHDAEGVWTTDHAKQWLDYTKSIGGHIAATEYMNEPTIMNMRGVAGHYGAKEYARDSKIFAEFLRKESPGTLYLGPSSASEGVPQTPPLPGGRLTSTETLMKEIGPLYDGFSYHVYYTRSHRCSGNRGTDVNNVLTQDWLDRGRVANQFFTDLRDRFLPGKDIWLTETGEASCGGDTWAAEFVDSFRLLDQFGVLAQKGVKSIMYNTLASSDYGMLDEETYEPRPNYWAALLWKRTMGTRSLDPSLAPTTDLRVYAQCMKDRPGGVSLLLLNVSRTSAQTVQIPADGTRYTLSSPELLSQTVMLNGRELKVAADGTVPQLQGEKFRRGNAKLDPLTITVLTLPGVSNPSCAK
jgi:heparanase 1